jgi:hypothetical protein
MGDLELGYIVSKFFKKRWFSKYKYFNSINYYRYSEKTGLQQKFYDSIINAYYWFEFNLNSPYKTYLFLKDIIRVHDDELVKILFKKYQLEFNNNITTLLKNYKNNEG